jgi:hypothetical protein
MFDLRYHIASLAAVFIALAVGIVIGVAIASGDKVPKKTIDFKNGQIADLQHQLDRQGKTLHDSRTQLSASTELLSQVYPGLLAGRLAGRSYAVLYLGKKDDNARAGIEDTLALAGAGAPIRTTTISLPFDSGALLSAVRDDAAFATLPDPAAIGEVLGRQFANGGDSLWSLVRPVLVEENSGQEDRAVDGVIVVGNWLPDPATDQKTKQEDDAANQLLDGLVQGLQDSGRTIVGVESWRGDGEPSTLGDFKNVSTVNDVDLVPGRVALAVLLAGDDKGHHYGLSAPNGVVPDLAPLVALAPTTTGAS